MKRQAVIAPGEQPPGAFYRIRWGRVRFDGITSATATAHPCWWPSGLASERQDEETAFRRSRPGSSIPARWGGPHDSTADLDELDEGERGPHGVEQDEPPRLRDQRGGTKHGGANQIGELVRHSVWCEPAELQAAEGTENQGGPGEREQLGHRPVLH
jgi:hypothetical protein